MNPPNGYFNLVDYKRVLEYADFPTWEEFSRVALISGAGIMLIGLVGFVMYALMSFIPM